MDLCSNGHKEICYNSNECPACRLIDVLKNAMRELKSIDTDNIEDSDIVSKIDGVISDIDWELR